MKTDIKSMMRYFSLIAIALVATIGFSACNNDDDEPTIPAAQTFKGTLTSSIPSFPNFEPVVSENDITVTWQNAEQTLATLELGAFSIDIQTPMGPKAYEIGAMSIKDVPCVKADGKITIPEYEFECMAGQFETTGTLSGVIENGELKVTFVYKPGSMPFNVQSVFEGK